MATAIPSREHNKLHRTEDQNAGTKAPGGSSTFHTFPSSLVVVIIASLVASYPVTDLFLFTVTLVFTNITFILPAIPFILAFVRPTTFLAPVLPIIIICKLQVFLSIGCRSRVLGDN